MRGKEKEQSWIVHRNKSFECKPLSTQMCAVYCVYNFKIYSYYIQKYARTTHMQHLHGIHIMYVSDVCSLVRDISANKCVQTLHKNGSYCTKRNLLNGTFFRVNRIRIEYTIFKNYHFKNRFSFYIPFSILFIFHI